MRIGFTRRGRRVIPKWRYRTRCANENLRIDRLFQMPGPDYSNEVCNPIVPRGNGNREFVLQ